MAENENENIATSGDIEIPIFPVIKEPKNSKKAFIEIQKTLEDSVGKQIDILNKKVLNLGKNLNLAFIKVGNKYAKALLNFDKQGKLSKFTLSTDKEGNLELFTAKQAQRLSEAINVESLHNIEKQIKNEQKLRQISYKKKQAQANRDIALQEKINAKLNKLNSENIIKTSKYTAGIDNIDNATDDQLNIYIKNLNEGLINVRKGFNYFSESSEKDTDIIKNAIEKTKNSMQELNSEIKKSEDRLKDLKQVEIESKIRQESQTRIETIKEWATLVGDNLTPLEKSKIQLNSMKKELSALQQQFFNLKKAGVNDLSEIENAVKKLNENINQTQQEIKKQEKTGAFGRLINTFVRVGFYRVAKGGLVGIEQSISQSIENLAKFDSKFNETMSNIKSSFTIMTNSLGLIIKPFVELFEPIIMSISRGIANLANAFSYLTAIIKGQNTYLKVNTEYWEDFNEQSNLLSFDKFEALNGTDDMFIKEDINNIDEPLTNILSALTSISLILAGIGSLKIIELLSSGKLTKGIIELISKLGDLGGKLKIISALLVFVGLYKIIKNVIDLITNWKDMTPFERLMGILKTILYTISTIAVVWGIFTKNPQLIVIGGIGIAGGIIGEEVGLYANGGLVDKGSLFVAGEAGAELITTMPSGQTGVTNVSQFKQAMVEALYEFSESQNNTSGDIILNLDGAEIARSKRFNKEMNIRNASLHLV